MVRLPQSALCLHKTDDITSHSTECLNNVLFKCMNYLENQSLHTKVKYQYLMLKIKLLRQILFILKMSCVFQIFKNLQNTVFERAMNKNLKVSPRTKTWDINKVNNAVTICMLLQSCTVTNYDCGQEKAAKGLIERKQH